MNNELVNHNRFNQDCFIFGNSPNVLDYDLTKFDNKFVVTVNKGYLLWKEGLKISDVHVVTDHNVFKSIYKDIEHLPKQIQKVFNRKIIKTVEYKKFSNIKNVLWFNEPSSINFLTDNARPLSFKDGWRQTWNVVADAILTCYFLGFKNIYVLGMDFDYSHKEKTHFYGTGVVEKELISKDFEMNNFKKKLIVLKNINVFLNNNNVSLYNCSKNWKHTSIIEYVDIEDVLSKG